MIDLVLDKLEVGSNGIKFLWSMEGDSKNIFKQEPLEVSYDVDVDVDNFVALNYFLSFFLPILVFEYEQVNIKLPFELDKSMEEYWCSYISKMKKDLDFNSTYKIQGGGELITVKEILGSKSNNIGIFYGGGVESSFTLSQTYHLKPILLSIVGKGWMNNNHSKESLKKNLEDELAQENDLIFSRISTNARYLVNKDDAYVNKMHTGFLFYHISLPICKKYNINMLLKTAELEVANNLSNYDYSFKASNSIHMNIKHPGMPYLMSAFNSFTKAQMLKELSNTKFIKYLYSCIVNSEKRWCGTCNKCFRISTFCEFMDIPKSLIGMQEGIVGIKERNKTTHIYYKMLEDIYGKKRGYFFTKKLAFYKRKGVRGALSYLWRKNFNLQK